MRLQTLNIPTGYAASFTTDAQTSGTYQQYDSVYTGYDAVTVNASTAYTVGPFNTPTNFLFTISGNEITFTQTYSGVVTAVDDIALALKAPIASPTFTGVVTIPSVITGYAADGALSTSVGIKKITKTSAAAMTLAAPVTGTDDGKVVVIVSTTAFAHTITATGLLQDGTTGGPHDLITLGAFPGAGITLMAMLGKWIVVCGTVAVVS